MNEITVSGLRKEYDGHTAVDYIDFVVKKGEIFGIV